MSEVVPMPKLATMHSSLDGILICYLRHVHGFPVDPTMHLRALKISSNLWQKENKRPQTDFNRRFIDFLRFRVIISVYTFKSHPPRSRGPPSTDSIQGGIGQTRRLPVTRVASGL